MNLPEMIVTRPFHCKVRRSPKGRWIISKVACGNWAISPVFGAFVQGDLLKAVIGVTAAKWRFVRSADLYPKRSEGPATAQNDRPKTRPAVCIVFRYRLRLRKGRSLKNTNTLKILYFLNAPF